VVAVAERGGIHAETGGILVEVISGAEERVEGDIAAGVD
jgi:hypothetical protein